MSLKIYAFPPSPRSFKVLAVAEHLGLDYEFCFLDLTKGAQSTPAFAAINPNKKAPALEDGDLKLWESNAIIQHLSTKRPGVLAPTDARGAADAARWLFWESTTWDPACATLVFERFVKGLFGGGGPDPVEVEKGLKQFNFASSVLDAHLKGRRFVCGDTLSVADFAIGASLTVAEPAQFPLEPYAEIRRWGDALAELPAWRAARSMQAMPAAA
jgi:glutathione S-transferase